MAYATKCRNITLSLATTMATSSVSAVRLLSAVIVSDANVLFRHP